MGKAHDANGAPCSYRRLERDIWSLLYAQKKP
jgi:hypothetical protein